MRSPHKHHSSRIGRVQLGGRARRGALIVSGAMATAGVLMLLAASLAAADSDKPGAGGHKVVICHATSSEQNPYTSNDVDVAGGWDGHDKHAGPVFSVDLPKQTVWGDIIPETSYRGVSFSLNWDVAGQAIWGNGCVVPGAETTTPPATETETTTPPATETETTTPPAPETTGATSSSTVAETSAAASNSNAVAGVSTSRAASPTNSAGVGGVAVGPIPSGAQAGRHAPTESDGLAIWGAILLLLGGTSGLLLALRPRRSRVH
jgi:hypothetical protein